MSEWQNIFNERSALLAFFGALGGLVRSVVIKSTWREGIRVVFVGCSTAFALGTLSPLLLRPIIGDLPEGIATALGSLCASAFLVGILAIALIERWVTGKSFKVEDKDNG